MQELKLILVFIFIIFTNIVTIYGEEKSTNNYSIDNRSWDGLSKLGLYLKKMGFKTTSSNIIDWGNLKIDQIVIIIFPQVELSGNSLRVFIRNGGKVIIADDFGKGKSLFNSLNIKHYQVDVTQEFLNYNNNPNLPIIINFNKHPITENVFSILCNHPSFFTTSKWKGVAFFGEFPNEISQEGNNDKIFAIAGTLGKGKFVALSDPSILINQTISLVDNRLFFENIIKWLSEKNDINSILILTGNIYERGIYSKNKLISYITPLKKYKLISEIINFLNKKGIITETNLKDIILILFILIMSFVIYLLSYSSYFKFSKAASKNLFLSKNLKSDFSKQIEYYSKGMIEQNYFIFFKNLKEDFEKKFNIPQTTSNWKKLVYYFKLIDHYPIIKRLLLLKSFYSLLKTFKKIDLYNEGAIKTQFFITKVTLLKLYKIFNSL